MILKWKLFWYKWSQAWHEIGAGSSQTRETDPGRIEASWENCFKMELDPLESQATKGCRHFVNVWISVWETPLPSDAQAHPDLILHSHPWRGEGTLCRSRSHLRVCQLWLVWRKQGRKENVVLWELPVVSIWEGHRTWGRVSTELSPWINLDVFFLRCGGSNLEHKLKIPKISVLRPF